MIPSFPSPRRSASDGFTLIELLVVISIIAVLAGLLLPVVSSVTQNARKTEAKSTEQQIVAAVKNYETEYGQYPVEAATPAVDVTFDNSSSSSGTATGLYGHNGTLFAVLRATNNSSSGSGSNGPSYDAAVMALNPRQIVYFEANDVKTVSSPRSGFIPNGATGMKGNQNNTNVVPVVGDLVDPWGNLFYVRMDANYSGLVENPYNSGTSDSGSSINYGGGQTDPNPVTDYTTVIRTDVIAWSPGSDGYMGTHSSTGNATMTLPPGSDDVISWQ